MKENPFRMKYQSIILGVLSAFVCNGAAEAIKRFDCGTNSDEASKDFMVTVKSLNSGQASGSAGARKRAAAALAARSQETIDIPTYFHVVSSEAKDGQVTKQMAEAQIAELNSAYAPHNIQFSLVATSWTVNDAWAVGDADDDVEMKKALREGSYAALNVYFQTDLAGNILGRCTLPSAVAASGTSESTAFIMDGCNVQANTMPGGSIIGYNLGKTVIHETGHWMGLLHTFEGYSCKGDGDFVDDTPAQSTSTDGCPVKPMKDSCPGEAGVDNIRNYMDYSTG